MATILDHIDAALRAKGLKDATASRMAAGNPSLIKNIRSGGGNVGYESLRKLAAVLDLEIYFGPRRETVGVEQLEIDGEDFARVPLHEASFSAGPGIENGDAEVIGHLVFGKDWLRKVGVQPEFARMARVSGDSMSPCIQSGDLVMIDTTRKEVPVMKKSRAPSSLPIFAFTQDNEARVKRLARWSSEKILVLYSDNKDVLPELIAESDAHVLNILGQVVWSGHVWR
jgi:hypothetical protein